MDNVVQIGDFSIERLRRFSVKEHPCEHRRLTMEEVGEVVRCRDCSAQVSAFWTLEQILIAHREALSVARRTVEKVNAERNTILHLIAARKAEKAWRHPRMVPTCPHCSAGIFPQDGFGSRMTNKKLEMRRRAGAKA
jgi:predicted metal-dependent phosphoesterase TrpH